MKERAQAQKVIAELEDDGFYAECPCCGEPVKLSSAGLFYMDEFTPEARQRYEVACQGIAERKELLAAMRKKIKSGSERGAKAVNIGFVLERLAPGMKGFRFDKNDCRSLFDPIDYVIFEGLSAKGRVSRLIFADIKTGDARLQAGQKAIRAAVEAHKVEWDTYQSAAE